MITIETEIDSTIITLIDPQTGKELEIIAAEEGYYLRQFDERLGRYDLIFLTELMLKMMLKSMTLTDGVYEVEQ